MQILKTYALSADSEITEGVIYLLFTFIQNKLPTLLLLSSSRVTCSSSPNTWSSA